MKPIYGRLWARSPTVWPSQCSSHCISAIAEGWFMNVEQNQLRLLPSIDELLQSTGGQQLISQYSRSMTLHAVRASIELARADIRNGAACPSPEALLDKAGHLLEIEQRPHLQPVINASGVIINTNLGRAPLSEEALQAMQQVA